MPKKSAVIDYQKCNPSNCEKGICTSVLACSRKVLIQEGPYEKPDPPMICVGCGICVKECVHGAVILI